MEGKVAIAIVGAGCGGWQQTGALGDLISNERRSWTGLHDSGPHFGRAGQIIEEGFGRAVAVDHIEPIVLVDIRCPGEDQPRIVDQRRLGGIGSLIDAIRDRILAHRFVANLRGNAEERTVAARRPRLKVANAAKPRRLGPIFHGEKVTIERAVTGKGPAIGKVGIFTQQKVVRANAPQFEPGAVRINTGQMPGVARQIGRTARHIP